MAPRSVPELYALARGVRCEGPRLCFYCTAPCDGTYPTSTYVKESFNSRAIVKVPGSAAVCVGCVLAMDEKADITLLDGERREAQKTRMYSWVVTASSATAATKAHLHLLRPIFLSPPEPPFALVLTETGQKQLLFRGHINHDRAHVVCTLEERVISYRPHDLRERLDLCGRLVVATGKPALEGPPSAHFGMAVVERYGEEGERLLDCWARCREEPLSALAIFLSPGREQAQQIYQPTQPQEAHGTGHPAGA